MRPFSQHMEAPTTLEPAQLYSMKNIEVILCYMTYVDMLSGVIPIDANYLVVIKQIQLST